MCAYTSSLILQYQNVKNILQHCWYNSDNAMYIFIKTRVETGSCQSTYLSQKGQFFSRSHGSSGQTQKHIKQDDILLSKNQALRVLNYC